MTFILIYKKCDLNSHHYQKRWHIRVV